MIAVTDKNDPRMVLEKLHEQWTAAAKTRAHVQSTNANATEGISGQDFLQHKRKTGA
jgi:hypothetical protein